MKVSLVVKIFLMVVAGILVSRFMYGILRKTSIKIKSVCFRTQADDILTIGNNSTYVPFAGEGMYAIAVINGITETHVKTLHMGVLTVDTFYQRFNEMDKFFTNSIEEGASVLTIISIGSTHKKPALEVMRVGIAHGAFGETATILEKYGMKKFIGFGHGVRQPYAMIHDVGASKTVSERSGSIGGKLVLRSVA